MTTAVTCRKRVHHVCEEAVRGESRSLVLPVCHVTCAALIRGADLCASMECVAILAHGHEFQLVSGGFFVCHIVMKKPPVEDAECVVGNKRRRLKESDAKNFFARLDNVLKSILVAFLHFEARILFPLGEVEVWVDSEVTFPRAFFAQGGTACRELRVAWLIRWLPSLRKVRGMVVQAAISQINKQSLRHLLTTEVSRLITRHDLSDSTVHLVTGLSSHPCLVQGLVASQDTGNDSTYTVITTSVAIPRHFFYLHFERATAAWRGHGDILENESRHGLESFIYFTETPPPDHASFRRLQSMRGRASCILDQADDLRGASLRVELQSYEGFRFILLRLHGSDGRALSGDSVRDALPPSGDWFFVLTINSSPNDSWQVRLEV